MGFHKRFINKETIKSTNEEHLQTLFNSDALIFGDEWSHEFYKMFSDGYKIKMIYKKLDKNEDT
jgi:hypothetical protein